MLQKASPAPHILPMIPIRAPGHMPNVNPMRVKDEAKPNSGGCEDSTDKRNKSVVSDFLIGAFGCKRQGLPVAMNSRKAPNDP